jgi:hypothetical protein
MIELINQITERIKELQKQPSDINIGKISELTLINIKLKALNIDDVSVSFNDSEKDEFIETTIFLNSQNLSGRETEDELYKQGITDCFDDLIDKINER